MKVARFVLKIVALALAVAALVCAVIAFWDGIVELVCACKEKVGKGGCCSCDSDEFIDWE